MDVEYSIERWTGCRGSAGFVWVKSRVCKAVTKVVRSEGCLVDIIEAEVRPAGFNKGRLEVREKISKMLPNNTERDRQVATCLEYWVDDLATFAEER